MMMMEIMMTALLIENQTVHMYVCISEEQLTAQQTYNLEFVGHIRNQSGEDDLPLFHRHHTKLSEAILYSIAVEQ